MPCILYIIIFSEGACKPHVAKSMPHVVRILRLKSAFKRPMKIWVLWLFSFVRIMAEMVVVTCNRHFKSKTAKSTEQFLYYFIITSRKLISFQYLFFTRSHCTKSILSDLIYWHHHEIDGAVFPTVSIPDEKDLFFNRDRNPKTPENNLTHFTS